MNRRDAIIDTGWLLFFGVASTIWCLTAAAHLSATFDEPTYIRYGLEHWQTGSYKQLMRLGTMPLAVDVQTLPIYLWQKWRGNPVPFEDALRVARAGTLVFWWCLLIYAFRAAKMIGGHWGGRIAVGFLACEPVLLGHAALATSDIAVTACLVVLAVEFQKGREGSALRRILVPAILYGLAILTKASALVFGPLCLFAIAAERTWRGDRPDGSRAIFKRSFLDIILILAGGLLVTFLYCGSDWTTERTFVEWAEKLSVGRWRGLMQWTAEHLRIFTNAGEGLAQQIKHNIRGHGTFILGREYSRAVWFYFPVAISIKTTLSLLSLPVILFVAHRTALRNWACAVGAILLVYSLSCRVQIGVRFMFPSLAFLGIGVGGAAAVALRQLSGWKSSGLAIWLVLAICSAAAESIQVWPNGICFTNLAWSGTTNGYRLLSDSNYDWGQGLFDLRTWQQKHDVPEVQVWYFGTDPAVNAPPLRELPLHRIADKTVTESVAGKVVAVSTTLLYGSYTGQPPGRDAAAFFRSRQPTDRTLTFFIYDFRKLPPP